MDEANRQEDRRIVEQLLRDMGYPVERDMGYPVENIPDLRPGPPELAIPKVDTERAYHVLRSLFCQGLSEEGHREPQKWNRYRGVLEAFREFGTLSNPVPLIAKKLECSEQHVYKIWRDLRLILKDFDLLYLEVRYRLTDELTRDVWQKIMIGKKPEAIRRHLKLDVAKCNGSIT